jgi:tetratricopeptide (TPR) repeat protein
MKPKIPAILLIACVAALGFAANAFSQPSEKYYLRLTPLKSPKDSLALEIELRFWQEFREQAEKSETVKIVSGWDEIVDLLEYVEEIARTPAIFDTSKIENPAMTPPNVHVAGTIRMLPREVEVDIQIKKIRTGVQIATGQVRIPISTNPFPVSYLPALRQLVQKLMAPLDPKIKKQKAWLGEPFDPEKINILVADFTNFEGNVDTPGKQWAWKTFNELEQFIKGDPALREVVEVKRLYSDSTGIVIREDNRAKEVGEAMNADMIIWGQNICMGDSICVYAKAFISHEARVASTIEGGVIHQTHLLRANLPMLIGAKANVLVKFIIGWTYLNDYRHQEFQRALQYLQQALSEISANERLSILKWAGEAAYYAGEYETALTLYAELKTHQIKTGDRSALAEIYNNIGVIYYEKSEWDKVLEYYGESEKIRLEVGDRAGLATTYNNIGLIHENKGEWNKALEYYGKSKKIRLEVGDHAGLATTYNNIGAIYDKKGEWNKALEFYQMAETINLEAGNHVGLAMTYNNIGLIYDKKGEWDKALKFYQKSEAIFLQVGDRANLATTYNNMGMIYYNKGEYDKALGFYQKSETINLKLGNRAGLATTYNNVGMVYHKKGDWNKALEFYDKSEAIFLDVGDYANLAATYNNIGQIYDNKGEGDKALEYYGKTEKILMEVGDCVHLIIAYNNIAAIYRKKEDFKQAIQFGERSLQIALQVGDSLNENLARFGLAQTLVAQKRYQEAITHLERCVEIDKQLKLPRLGNDLQWLLKLQRLKH